MVTQRFLYNLSLTTTLVAVNRFKAQPCFLVDGGMVNVGTSAEFMLPGTCFCRQGLNEFV
jgi:hypothetical protein